MSLRSKPLRDPFSFESLLPFIKPLGEHGPRGFELTETVAPLQNRCSFSTLPDFFLCLSQAARRHTGSRL
jgi:hypothetical protein